MSTVSAVIRGIVLRHGLGLGVVVLQDRQEGRRGRRAAGQGGEAVEEGPAVHAAMGEIVVEVDDALIHAGPPGWSPAD